jgi:hypothetical protein
VEGTDCVKATLLYFFHFLPNSVGHNHNIIQSPLSRTSAFESQKVLIFSFVEIGQLMQYIMFMVPYVLVMCIFD